MVAGNVWNGAGETFNDITGTAARVIVVWLAGAFVKRVFSVSVDGNDDAFFYQDTKVPIYGCASDCVHHHCNGFRAPRHIFLKKFNDLVTWCGF